MYISEQEGINTELAAAKVIARMAQGGMRDAISLLELCAGDGSTVTLEAVKAVTGAIGREKSAEVVQAIKDKDTDKLFDIIAKIVSSATEMTVFWQELTDFYRDMLIFKTAKAPESFLDLTAEEYEMIKSLTASINGATLMRHCAILEEAHANMLRQGASKRLCAEMALLKMCDDRLDTGAQGLAARITALEERIVGGAAVVTQSASAAAMPSASATVSYKKAVTPPPVAPVKPSSDVSVRSAPRQASWWAEATKKVCDTNPALGPFMRFTRAYEIDGTLSVRVDGAMAKDMLDTPQTRAMIASLSATYSANPITPDKISFIEAGGSGEETVNPIDEL
jgi:DNA polymerase-3 subunit gamma/tau